MIKIKQLIGSIDKRFWNHICKDRTFTDIIDFDDIDRVEFLKEVAISIIKGTFHFAPPLYFYAPKSVGVLRKIKSYELAATCIYYFCIKSIQDELIEEIKNIDNVFGGFRMTDDLKLTPQKIINLKTGVNEEFKDYEGKPQNKDQKNHEIENSKIDEDRPEDEIKEETESVDDILIEPDESYAIVPGILSKYAYRKEWSDYQNLAKKLHEDNYDFYIHVDIAHFYNDINLNILEKIIRSTVHKKDKIIDLLFFFLTNSDRNEDGFDRTTVSIPQEDVGEMSRLLANFYLTPLDKEMSELKESEQLKESNIVYTRYADDMWIAYNGSKDLAYHIIQKVSLNLNDLKLHVNEKKLSILNNTEFGQYWKFDVWAELKENIEDLNYLVDLKNRLYYEDKTGRWYSPFSYALTVIMNNYDGGIFEDNNEQTKQLIEQLFDTPQLAFSGGRKMKPKIKDFFVRILEDNSEVLNTFKDYLRSDSLVYPSQEYFLYQVICSFSNKEEVFQFIKDEYFKVKSNDYSWFSKIIILQFFIEHIDLIEKDLDYQKKLIKHLGKISNFANHYERRYNIRLLMKFRDNAGQDVLDDFYNKPEDYKFINYIRKK